MIEHIENYFIEREERRLEQMVAEMRKQGKTEYQICNYLNKVASLYLREMKGGCEKE